MNYFIRKLIVDYENEDKWLNQMSAKGYAFVDYSFYKYTFTECLPSEYIYKVAIIDEKAPERHIMQDDDIEIVTSYKNKVYYRKKTAAGPLEIHNDNNYKLKHYEKLFTICYILTIMEIAIGLGNMIMSRNEDFLFNIFVGSSILLIGIGLLISMVIPLYKKIKKIRKELENNQ